MLKQLIFLSIALAVLGHPKPIFKNKPLHGRIMGGHDVDIIDYPWQVSVEVSFYHYCGGSIISENYVLTAAQCTNLLKPEFMTVEVNTSKVESWTAKRINVAKFYQNPNYDPATSDYDISVLELATPLKFGVGVQPIKFPAADSPALATGSPVTVSGWGFVNVTAHFPYPQLQAVEIEIIDKDVCRQKYARSGFDISANMFCSGVPEDDKDSCSGDTGGPVISNGTLYGIISYRSQGCIQKGYPSVNTDVIALRSFITKITGL